MIAELILFFFVIIYFFFIFFSIRGFKKTTTHINQEGHLKNFRIAVIIPARNEADNIAKCIQSVIDQNYYQDLFEIILVDDHSEDETISAAKNTFMNHPRINFKILSNKYQSKKGAITTAIESTTADLILTTDADCIAGPNWIRTIADCYNADRSMLLCGPVLLNPGRNVFEKIQSIEFSGLVAISAAGIFYHHPVMCSGANMAFSRELFIKVSGYNNSKSVSGDDTQLLLKVNKYDKTAVSFIKNPDAIVTALAHSSGKSLVDQRKRWASKILTSLSASTIIIAFVAWLVHAGLLIQFFFILSGKGNLILFLSAVIFKILPEIILLRMSGNFFHQKTNPLLIIFAQPFYWIYIFLVGILAPFTGFHWKGKKYQ